MNIRRKMVLSALVGSALLIPASVLFLAQPAQGLLGGLWAITGLEVAAGGWQQDYNNLTKRRIQILAEIPTNPDILINITYSELPGTPDLTRLGRQATKALNNALLNNMDPGVRSAVASVMGEIRDPKSAEILLLALDDSNDEVRSNAVASLGKLGQASHAERIMSLIKDPEEPYYVKSAAISALGKLGEARTLPLLLSMLKQEEYLDLQWALVDALWMARGKINRDKLVEAFIDIVENQRPAANQVISQLGWLKDEDAVEPLAAYFVGKDDWLKNDIIVSVGRIGGKEAKNFLKKAMDKTQNARQLNNSALALAEMGEKEWVINRLEELLKDRRAYFRINAAFSLGELGKGNEKAIMALEAGLEDPNDYVRSESAVALGRIADPRSAPALEKALATTNPFIELDLVIALNRIDYKKYNQLIFDKLLVRTEAKFKRIRERGIKFLAEAKDDRVIPYILAYLHEGNANASTFAFSMLSDLGKIDPEVFKAAILQAIIGNPGSSSESSATALIRANRIQGLEPFLIENLYHVWSDVKNRTYLTLGQVADPGYMESIAAVKETSQETMMYKLYALASLGNQEALEKLINVLETGSLNQKRDAAFVLGYLEKPVARDRLTTLLSGTDDPLTGINACYALLPHKVDEAYDYLYKTMKTATPALADEAERTFRVSPAKQILPFLQARLDKEKDLMMRQRLSTLIYDKDVKDFR